MDCLSNQNVKHNHLYYSSSITFIKPFVSKLKHPTFIIRTQSIPIKVCVNKHFMYTQTNTYCIVFNQHRVSNSFVTQSASIIIQNKCNSNIGWRTVHRIWYGWILGILLPKKVVFEFDSVRLLWKRTKIKKESSVINVVSCRLSLVPNFTTARIGASIVFLRNHVLRAGLSQAGVSLLGPDSAYNGW